jgi:hypothetical protein
MPVVVLDKVAKGYQGYIGAVHEIYEKDNGKDSKGNSIPYVNPDIKKKTFSTSVLEAAGAAFLELWRGISVPKPATAVFSIVSQFFKRRHRAWIF